MKYKKSKIDLITSLVELVFRNCYFKTPYGIYGQTKSMPMGDYSSRDNLDIDLARFVQYFIVNELRPNTCHQPEGPRR